MREGRKEAVNEERVVLSSMIEERERKIEKFSPSGGMNSVPLEIEDSENEKREFPPNFLAREVRET
ncbi:hypothetical protein CCACVL1_19645 [Corchorus capsularis]|uniref:Uncharacterized protein n=1 Tax=Corchorus capsularis TaxID=210143 RepID=A0A1R3HFK8_COCAP|nr:hypothetical protein CCACVL1_19645 [Corchorus capsularis]